MMTVPGEHILVLGHRNPDTDASTSACAYAELLNRCGSYDAPVSAGILGPLPPQSRHVFERAGIELPPLVDSVRPRVRDVATGDFVALSADDRFGAAIEKMVRTGVSMLPIVDDRGGLQGVLSHRSDIARYFFAFDVIPVMGMLLSWEDLVALPGGEALGPVPEDTRLGGQLRVALEGETSWVKEIQPEDILLCGDAAVLDRLPAESRPRWLVLVGPESSGHNGDVAALESRGTHVMRYSGSVPDFLLALLPQVRIGALNLEAGPCVGELDQLDDIRQVVLEHPHALPVLTPDGAVAGTISRTDLLKSPRRRVILVDHFESAQSVEGIEGAEILEIIDHHRIGDIETPQPVRVDCRPLGSSSTIVALRFLETETALERSVATLLLGGLISDTVCLRSPTATPADRQVATRLAEAAGLDLERFGREVLAAGDDLLTAKLEQMWNRDQKVFGILNHAFAVAQLETVALDALPGARLDRLRELLAADFERSGYLLSLLVLTDVLRGESWIASCETSAAVGVVETCFGATQPRPGWLLAREVVSRKKQVIPPLLGALARCAL